jgi:hypothetical protein
MSQTYNQFDYDGDIDTDDLIHDYDYWYEDDFESYHKDTFLRWYYGKPKLDEFDIEIDYTYGIEI